jgi:hypothetical protein
VGSLGAGRTPNRHRSTPPSVAASRCGFYALKSNQLDTDAFILAIFTQSSPDALTHLGHAHPIVPHFWPARPEGTQRSESPHRSPYKHWRGPGVHPPGRGAKTLARSGKPARI